MTELSAAEMESTDGGFLFLGALALGLLWGGTTAGAIFVTVGAINIGYMCGQPLC